MNGSLVLDKNQNSFSIDLYMHTVGLNFVDSDFLGVKSTEFDSLVDRFAVTLPRLRV